MASKKEKSPCFIEETPLFRNILRARGYENNSMFTAKFNSFLGHDCTFLTCQQLYGICIIEFNTPYLKDGITNKTITVYCFLNNNKAFPFHIMDNGRGVTQEKNKKDMQQKFTEIQNYVKSQHLIKQNDLQA